MSINFKSLIARQLKEMGFASTSTSFRLSGVIASSINEVYEVTVDGVTCFIVKKNNQPLHKENLIAESDGMRALKSIIPKHIPQVFGVKSAPSFSILVLEKINKRAKEKEFFASSGRALAELHLHKQENRYGWHANNFIGSMPQIGGFQSSWSRFYIEKRLQPQVAWLNDKSMLTADFNIAMERLYKRLDSLLNHQPIASLVHGDLWSGNALCGDGGGDAKESYFIDPAVYYGDREVDLAMTELFGGFDDVFYEAYNDVYPILPDFFDRKDIYNLYHILNHANIFGSSYLSQAERIVKRYI